MLASRHLLMTTLMYVMRSEHEFGIFKAKLEFDWIISCQFFSHLLFFCNNDKKL